MLKESNISAMYIFRGFMLNRVIVIMLPILFLVGSLIYIFSVNPIYRSDAYLAVEPEPFRVFYSDIKGIDARNIAIYLNSIKLKRKAASLLNFDSQYFDDLKVKVDSHWRLVVSSEETTSIEAFNKVKLFVDNVNRLIVENESNKYKDISRNLEKLIDSEPKSSLKSSYNNLLMQSKYKAALLSTENIQIIYVVKAATATTDPVRPKKLLLVSISSLFGLTLAILFVLVKILFSPNQAILASLGKAEK